MPDLGTLGVFAVAAVLFAVVPGPAVIYVVTRSIEQGRRAGVISALGIELGNLVHVFAATIGLSALLMSSATAFTIVRYLGAAYLVYLGVRKLLERGETGTVGSARTASMRRLFRQGAMVATLNPKTALFFLAFLPQFVHPSHGSVALQIGSLGVLLVAITAVSDSVYAVLSGTAGTWLRNKTPFLRIGRLLSGGVYIGLGFTAAFSGSRSQS